MVAGESFRECSSPSVDSGVDAAVAAVRRLAEALLRTGDGTAVDLDDLARRVHALSEEVEVHTPALDTRMVDMWSGEGATRHDPVTGPENALAPPLHLTGHDDGSVSGTVRLGVLYQGPPGCVHGGVSALLLDHTLGVANAWAGTAGMTGTLTVRYHAPVPLHEDLVVSGRQERVEGRKIWTTGSISHDGRVLVSTEGLFIDALLQRPR